jgi:hypothetical protein
LFLSNRCESPNHDKKKRKNTILFAVCMSLLALRASAQETTWRQSIPAELASVLPSQAPVVNEHIETEMRTASGIVDEHGRFIVGVVLITAGYSAEGKYSHHLIVQAPGQIGAIPLKHGEYAFGWTREDGGDSLRVHFNHAETGGTGGKHRCTQSCGFKPGGELAHLAARRQGVDPAWAVWDSIQAGRRVAARRRTP